MSREAMKLALEALEESLGYVEEEAENAQRLYGQYPTRQARIQGLKDDVRKHMKAIITLREALAATEQQEPVAKDSRDCPYCYHTGSVHCGDVKAKILSNGGDLGYCSNAQVYGRRTQPQQEQMTAAVKDAVFDAAIEFVGTLTGMKPPPIETAPPEIFKPFRDFTEKVCSIFAAPQPAPVGSKT